MTKAAIAPAGVALPAAEPVPRAEPGPIREFWIRLKARRSAMLGLVIVVALILMAVFADWIAPYDPIATDWGAIRTAPSWAHPFGTDEVGHDVLSRIVFGARASLGAGLTSVALAVALGLPFGLLAGYAGGVVDLLIMRLTDALLAIPFLILAIALAAFLGPSLTNAMVAIGLSATSTFVRLTRAQVQAVAAEEFVEAARAVGNPPWRIAIRHIVPNIVPAILVQATLTIAAAIIAEASLSFLGLGQQPPEPSWGSMLNVAKNFLEQAPWMAIWPGASIFLAVLAFNLLGDGLRDALDPRQRDLTMAQARQTLLDVRDLAVAFDSEGGAVHAVNGVSYTLAEGETLGIVGESGSGKSVHVLAMLGLIPRPPGRITGGQVLFQGRDLLGLPERELRNIRGGQIGFVFQDPMSSLNPGMTVAAQIIEPLRIHLGLDGRAARARTKDLLDLVRIPNAGARLDQYPHEFSGGQRQRVMIAIGLSCRPKLLIADEATTALDVTVQAEIIGLVQELKREIGMAIVWITHDLGVVAGIADTVQVMYAGRILERGPVDDIFRDPRSAYTLGLLRSLPDLSRGRAGRRRLHQIEGAPPDMRHPPAGDPFAARNIYATPRCLTEAPPLAQAPGAAPGHLVAAWYDLPARLAAEEAAR